MVTTFGSARDRTNPSVPCLSFNTIECQGGKRLLSPFLSIYPNRRQGKEYIPPHFNGLQKSLCSVDETGHYYRADIDSIDDIYDYAEQLKATVHRYENTDQRHENP